MCSCLLCAPYWGPGPHPRDEPWLGIEQATLWFAGPCSIHWAAPARAIGLNLNLMEQNQLVDSFWNIWIDWQRSGGTKAILHCWWEWRTQQSCLEKDLAVPTELTYDPAVLLLDLCLQEWMNAPNKYRCNSCLLYTSDAADDTCVV